MRKKHLLAAAAVLLAGLAAGGCSKSQINYQVAKSIGTLGMYENNEPVETPKMKAEREFREAQEKEEAFLTGILEDAAYLAKGYEYEQAIEVLQAENVNQEDERVLAAISEYQSAIENVYEYDGAIPQLCFPNLIVDTQRCFSESGNGSSYASVMITLDEFKSILQEMYDNGYFLIDMRSLMAETENEDGTKSWKSVNPLIPQGKKPFVLSIENLDYSQVRKNGDGIATKLALNEEGEVKAVYTDDGGHDLKGDYDVIPVLETFIKEHPDFSYRGARGVIGLCGKSGAFGYRVEDDAYTDYSENRKTVTAIANRLIEDGWTIACETYSYNYVKDMSYDTLTQEITNWKNSVGSLTGKTDVMMYPYGSEVESYADNKGSYLLEEGFRYFIGLWASNDFREVQEDYMRMTRRMVSGYVFQTSPEVLDAYFNVASVLDSAR